MKIDIMTARSKAEIRKKIFAGMAAYDALLPTSKTSSILIKPNLNANMNALTGNTTDLRLLAAVIEYFKENGYRDITVAEGTNSGYYRNNISVISRLRVDRLAEYFGVRVIDLNYSKPVELEFDNGVTAQVATECVEADFMINLPKLKTHFEVGMSVCLKNLMGCLIGQANKKKTHDNLPENILRINQSVKPHLHIVDALVAMEGLGPTRGTPVRLDTILMGADPILMDLVCAGIAGFDYRNIRTLALAEKKGLLTSQYLEYAASLDLSAYQKPFEPPRAGPLASFIHNPKRQKFFLKIRATGFFSYLAATKWFGKLLFLTGLRQDVFSQQEMALNGLVLDEKLCENCNTCKDVCPVDLELPADIKQLDAECIECLYCYSACPNQAIAVEGELGFFGEQLRQYNDRIRKLYS